MQRNLIDRLREVSLAEKRPHDGERICTSEEVMCGHEPTHYAEEVSMLDVADIAIGARTDKVANEHPDAPRGKEVNEKAKVRVT
jgi:hypothetical protein